MKIEVKANDFCPDNCPFCEPEFVLLTNYLGTQNRGRVCSNQALCRQLYGLLSENKDE